MAGWLKGGSLAFTDAPVTNITRDGNGRLTGYTSGNVVVSQITRDATTGLIASYTQNGVNHVLNRDANNKITGVT